MTIGPGLEREWLYAEARPELLVKDDQNGRRAARHQI